MKHKRQHSNGSVSKEERTNRIRQLLGSPTTHIRILKPDDPERSGEAEIKVVCDNVIQNLDIPKKSFSNKALKPKRKLIPAEMEMTEPKLDHFRMTQADFIPEAETEVANFDAKDVSADANFYLSNEVDQPGFEPATPGFLPPADVSSTTNDACRGFHDAYSNYSGSGYGSNSHEGYQTYPDYQQHSYGHSCEFASDQSQQSYYYSYDYSSDYYHAGWHHSSEQASDEINQYPAVYPTEAFQ